MKVVTGFTESLDEKGKVNLFGWTETTMFLQIRCIVFQHPKKTKTHHDCTRLRLRGPDLTSDVFQF